MPRQEAPSNPAIEIVFGNFVRKRRIELGLRLIDLQTEGGIDRSHIGKIEAGKVQVCLRGIIQIAEGLEMTPGALLDEVMACAQQPKLR